MPGMAFSRDLKKREQLKPTSMARPAASAATRFVFRRAVAWRHALGLPVSGGLYRRYRARSGQFIHHIEIRT